MWCWSVERYWDKPCKPIRKDAIFPLIFLSFQIVNRLQRTTRSACYMSLCLLLNNLSQTTNNGASAGFQFIKKIQLFLTIVYFLFVFSPSVHRSISHLFSSLSMLNTFDKVGRPLGPGNSLTRLQWDYLCVQSLLHLRVKVI